MNTLVGCRGVDPPLVRDAPRRLSPRGALLEQKFGEEYPAVSFERSALFSIDGASQELSAVVSRARLRSALGLGAGVAREVGEIALPDGVRNSRLYQNLVDATLRFLIEQVGGVEGVYAADSRLPDDFLVRRTAGNAVEVLGIVAFRASPVWIFAALADLCGMGRQLIPEIADALKAQGLLDKEAQFATVDQLLDGLERTSSRLASTINTPPLDVQGLRNEWEAIRAEARTLPPASLPGGEAIAQLWAQLKTEAVRQNRSVFETSSLMAVSAVRALPSGVRWLSASALAGAARTGQCSPRRCSISTARRRTRCRRLAPGLCRPPVSSGVRAAVDQFSPERRTSAAPAERLQGHQSSDRRLK